jgi:HK97 gp10 family phage protein
MAVRVPREVIKVEVKGLKQTAEALRQLPFRMMKRTVIAGTITSGKVVLDELKRRVPRKTGRLAKSLTMTRPRTRRGNVTIQVGPSKYGFYGRFLEFGTSKISARPWMRPAFDASVRDAIDAFAERAKRDLPEDVRAVAAPKQP